MEDLWPDFNDPLEDIRMPHEILNAQAKFLSEKTNGSIYAEVIRLDFNETYMTDDFDEVEGTLGYRFVIRSRYMEHYKFELLKIIHDFDFYPVTILLDEKMCTELGRKKTIFKIHSEFEYLELLKRVFSSKRLLNVITVMRKIN
ncbi:hypothetical protein [Paenibacillus ferrarius]|uniref:hypothetical protein n=1 Tax=Paenibacillus ferrarius TaxID=1469647 RepID=UPI003D27E9EC